MIASDKITNLRLKNLKTKMPFIEIKRLTEYSVLFTKGYYINILVKIKIAIISQVIIFLNNLIAKFLNLNKMELISEWTKETSNLEFQNQFNYLLGTNEAKQLYYDYQLWYNIRSNYWQCTKCSTYLSINGNALKNSGQLVPINSGHTCKY